MRLSSENILCKIFCNFVWVLTSGVCFSVPSYAQDQHPNPPASQTTTRPVAALSTTAINAKNENIEATELKPKSTAELINKLRRRIEEQKFEWDLSFFSFEGWQIGGQTVNGLPLIYWSCGNRDSANRSLVLSNVHGDEVTPVYFGFRLVEWLKARPSLCENKFVVVAPIVNPDGFLRYSRGTRTNYNKVDLNRNFHTEDWDRDALRLWASQFQKRQRNFPGPKAASEPETIFQQWLIDEFKPKKIMSIHAPLNILDYDGPDNKSSKEFSRQYIEACEALKSEMEKRTQLLRFQYYGYFPGSLGNYAGKERGIPTITTELPTSSFKLAPSYFGLLEKSTQIFFDYQIN